MLSTKVLDKVKQVNKKILIVTKYWNKEKTKTILQEAETQYSDIFYGLWENTVHFIGNIQSQKISEIVKHCCVIHSLSSLKHAIKINNIWLPISAFIQINLDPSKDNGISEDNLWYFLQACDQFNNLKIIWISGMWAWDISETEKRAEFQKLIFLRNKHMPNWLISAGTSRDYELALQEWIDIVRIGTSAIKKEA
jgi:uncharacterized pyridoxal phosphate-containing UPF0001 family protein